MATAHQQHDRMMADREAIAEFLTETVIDSIHLVAITPDSPASGRWFGNDATAAADWARQENMRGRNLYWSVNAVHPGLHAKPKKADMVAARFAHVDIDPPKTGEPFDAGEAGRDATPAVFRHP